MGLNRLLGDLAHNLDSASVGSYQGKSDFSPIAYSSLSGTPSTILDSAVATSIVDSAYINARQASGFTNIDSALASNVVDSAYINARIGGGGSGFFVYEFETTAGQTAIQDSDLNGNLMSYTAEGILVFKNGVLLLDSDDYTATDGSVVTLTSAADSGSNITISKFVLGGGGGGAATDWYGDRAIVFGHGTSASTPEPINYFDITTTGNASSFGNMTRGIYGGSAVSNATYGVVSEAYDDVSNTGSVNIDYVTISTTSNASDFGDLTVARRETGSSSDATYGLWSSGLGDTTTIDYVTIASPSNATDFGDMSVSRFSLTGCGHSTYGLFGGGHNGSVEQNVIDYVTIASPGNATDFGDLTVSRRYVAGACGDGTYGVFHGGLASGSTHINTIDYVTVATPGNASDFGDLTGVKSNGQATNNSTRGVVMAGWTTSYSQVQNIDYYTIASPGNAASFGSLGINNDYGAATSGSPS